MPLNKTKASSFKRNLADDLLKLADVLIDISPQIVRDAGALHTAASECSISKNDTWSYSVSQLEFIAVPGDTHHRIEPHNSIISSIYLSVEIGGKCYAPQEYEDPFQYLEVSILVEGYKDSRNLRCAWHLDSHPPRETKRNDRSREEATENEPSFAHPRYHFQYGGRKVWGLSDQDYGSQLLLEAPRIAHPPLDAVLAIDFVLSNYYGLIWLELRDTNPQYRDIVAQAQERCWRAYSSATASIWESPTIDQSRSWKGEIIWPQLSLSHRRSR